ncbi:MAG: maleylacetoacetate isomerase [Polyangiaceae bacterium]
MKLYSYFRSSASYRVRIGLGLKGLSYEYVPVNLVRDGGEQFGEAHRARNRMEQVPVLVVEDGGATVELTQSVAILEYLDERYPEPRLLPADRLQRAFVRRAVEIVNSGIQPLQNLSVLRELARLGADEKAFARAANERGLAALEIEAKARAGRFFLGDTPTMADVFLVPQMFGARRFGVDLTPFPTLVRIDEALAKIPAVAAAHPDKQPDAAP